MMTEKQRLYLLLEEEYIRSNKKHGPFPADLYEGVTIVAEELGELAREVIEYKRSESFDSKSKMKMEAIQLLNTAYKLAEVIYRY